MKHFHEQYVKQILFLVLLTITPRPTSHDEFDDIAVYDVADMILN